MKSASPLHTRGRVARTAARVREPRVLGCRGHEACRNFREESEKKTARNPTHQERKFTMSTTDSAP